MAPPASFRALPFTEQVAFFRKKLNLPTESWTDIMHGQHAHAFVVAGAARNDLLSDLRAAVDKAIAGGTTLQEFRRDFDKAVERTGWTYNGGRNWRSRVIYDTNLRTSYMAGRYQQLQAVKAARPFWRYQHSDLVAHPRPQHLAWNGLVLSADDPWWSTHYPPNGWGCRCNVEPLATRDLTRLGKNGPDQAPPIEYEEVTVGSRGPHPRTITVPKGIDPGWGYNVGEAAFGRSAAQSVLDAEDGGRWVDVPYKTAADYGRPARVPLDAPKAAVGPRANSPAEVYERLRTAIGGDQAIYQDPLHEPVIADRALADHIVAEASRMDGREQYFPFIREIVEAPFEVWVSFARNELTGRYAIRRRYVKAIAAEKARGLSLVAESVNGIWVGTTFFRGSGDLKNARKGFLVWGRKE